MAVKQKLIHLLIAAFVLCNVVEVTANKTSKIVGGEVVEPKGTYPVSNPINLVDLRQ